MNINTFEEIKGWQKARELSILVYKHFGTLKDYGFRDQITRASVSIMNNIAEGFGREGKKEFIRYLIIARSSAFEVQSMIILSKDLNYITEEVYLELNKKSIEVINLLGGFLKYLKNQITK
jgi:four helix bundle protein